MTSQAKERRVRGYLADGSFVLVPKNILGTFIGVDEHFNPIIQTNEVGEMQAISNCCGAWGKGSDSGIVCRSCHKPCDGLGYDLMYSQIFIKARQGQR